MQFYCFTSPAVAEFWLPFRRRDLVSCELSAIACLLRGTAESSQTLPSHWLLHFCCRATCTAVLAQCVSSSSVCWKELKDTVSRTASDSGVPRVRCPLALNPFNSLTLFYLFLLRLWLILLQPMRRMVQSLAELKVGFGLYMAVSRRRGVDAFSCVHLLYHWSPSFA